MNQAMKDDLRGAWTAVRDDPDVWVAIITGEGRAFSSGADVESLDSRGFRKVDRFRELAMIETIRALPTPRRMGVMKPVIAAVNGLVNGVSLDLVTESDIPIASEKAEFFDSHVSLGYVSSHEMVNMARRVPVAVTLRMALLGQRSGWVRAAPWRSASSPRSWSTTDSCHGRESSPHSSARNAPLAVWGTKLAILRGLGLPIEQAEEIAAGYLEIVEQSEDHAEGPRAFLEKRPPRWQAR
jgi:enoyl-CoA hydratase/carnithine racemase